MTGIRIPEPAELERLRQVFDCDVAAGRLTNRIRRGRRGKIGEEAGCPHKKTGGWTITCDGRNYSRHQVVWFFATGSWPALGIDHRRGREAGDGIDNLRLATDTQNLQNQRRAHSDSQSGLLGVSWYAARRKWRARIAVDKKDVHLGTFNTREQAHAAYLAAKAKLHPFQTLV